MKKQTITITETEHNQRIDVFLSSQLDLSRARIQKLIKSSHILVDQEPTKSSLSIQIGQTITVTQPEPTNTPYKPVELSLDIIYEDKNVIVINKPSNLIVHPRNENDQTTTLVNGILAHCKDSLSGIGGKLRPGIVHRLDKHTSGVIIIAKNDTTHELLSKQFEARTPKKLYQTLIIGRFPTQTGIIDSPIYRNPIDRKKMAVSNNSKARSSKTKFKVMKTYKDKLNAYSLLQVELLTGRTHQIRVHMQAINHQVVGDDMYGVLKTNIHFKENYDLQRQFLHAHKLTINIPEIGRKTFTAPLAPDLKDCLKKLTES